jgi:hypothetical protein
MKNLPINLADIIRGDCVIRCPNGKIVGSDYIRTLTNVYKKRIFDQLNGQTVGKVGLIWSNKLDTILPCIKAMWKLGCVVSVHDYHKAIVNHPAFKNFYSHIDFVVGTPDSNEIFPDLPHIPAPETQLDFLSYIWEVPEREIYQFSAEDFPDIEYNLDKPLGPNSTAVVSHTSGTTGDPKIFGISHSDAIDLINENIKIFNFNENDRVGHFKTLHHGSLFLNYAMPAFATSRDHYWFIENKKSIEQSDKILSSAMQFCADNGLTKLMIHYRFFNEENLKKSDSTDISKTSVITIVSPKLDFLTQFFDKFNPACVYNNFGCTEIGTIAVSKTTKETLTDYAPNKFNIINEIIDIMPKELCFLVKYKTQTEWKEIGDFITLESDGLTFHGRNNKINIRENLYNILDIHQSLNTLGLKNFSLVPDFSNQSLYLAFFEQEEYTKFTLEEINKDLEKLFDDPSLILKSACFSLNSMIQGIKPSQPLLLYAFRKQ